MTGRPPLASQKLRGRNQNKDMNNARYEIRIVGTGPASNGNATTDADLMLQEFLRTLKSQKHETTTAVITVNGTRIVLEGNKAALASRLAMHPQRKPRHPKARQAMCL